MIIKENKENKIYNINIPIIPLEMKNLSLYLSPSYMTSTCTLVTLLEWTRNVVCQVCD